MNKIKKALDVLKSDCKNPLIIKDMIGVLDRETEKLKLRTNELDYALELALLSMVALVEYANDELDEEQHKSVFDDINRFRKVLLKEWDS